MVAVIKPFSTLILQGDVTDALPLPPSKTTSIVYSPSSMASASSVSPSVSAPSSYGTGSDTETLWSYQVPFVPTRAKSNYSSRYGTGTSKPLTSSVCPSGYVTSSSVGSNNTAPSA